MFYSYTPCTGAQLKKTQSLLCQHLLNAHVSGTGLGDNLPEQFIIMKVFLPLRDVVIDLKLCISLKVVWYIAILKYPIIEP